MEIRHLDLTKPLNKRQLREYLEPDFHEIVEKMYYEGFVCENDYKRLGSQFCKHNASSFVEELCRVTNLNITYLYEDMYECIFVFYDKTRYNATKIKKLLKETSWI